MKNFLTPNTFKVITLIFLGIYIFLSALSFNERHDSPAGISVPGVVLSLPFFYTSNFLFVEKKTIVSTSGGDLPYALVSEPSEVGYFIAMVIEIVFLYFFSCLVSYLKEKLWKKKI